jgi:autotransporter-associated beta strand protein
MPTNSPTATDFITIGAGNSLTVNSDFTVGSTSTGTGVVTTGVISGGGTLNFAGGTLFIENTANTNTTIATATLDLSGLAAVNFTNSGSAIYIGTGPSGFNGNGTYGSLLLSNISNTITANVIRISVGGSSGAIGLLRLGQTNVLNVNEIHIADGKGPGTMQFGSGLASPTLSIHGPDGVSRVNTWTLADYSFYASGNAGTNSTGVANFSGGVLNALVNNLTIGIGRIDQQDQLNAVAVGTFTYDGGSLDVNNVVLGQGSGSIAQGGGATGTLNVGGNATLTINSSLILGNGAPLGGTVPVIAGVLNASGSSSMIVNTDVSDGGGVSTVTVANSAVVDLAGHNFGSLVSPIDNLTMTGGKVQNFASLTVSNLSGTSGRLIAAASNPAAVVVGGTANSTYAGTIEDGASGGVVSVTKQGAATLILAGNNTYTGGTTVSSGTLNLASPRAIGVGGSLTVAGGNVTTAAGLSNAIKVSSLNVSSGNVDLNDNDLIVTYTAGNSPSSSIRSLLSAGYSGGAWNNTINSITSTAAANDASKLKALGYGDAADLGITSDDGVAVGGNAVVVKFTWYGDSSLDGKVDLGNDFNLFLQGFIGANASSWVFGDYNYDGKVDSTDFQMFVDGYKQQSGNLGSLDNVIEASPLLTTSQKAQLLSAVPEPSAAAIMLIGAAAAVSRRRRK